jgi:hypothetical protein
MAKRAKTMAEDEPATSTAPGDDVVDTSPRRSPQREATIQFPLASVGVEIFTANINTGVGEEHHEEEHPEADPTGASLSTAAPTSGSPARTSTDEPIRADDMPATEAARNRATITEVVREETVPPQQSQSSKPPAIEYFSLSIFFFVFLNLI